MKAPLKAKYEKTIVPELKKQLGIENIMALPKLIKVSVNVGIGNIMTQGNKDYAFVEENIATITGQKPRLQKARKAISNFKLREGIPVGLNVTLRGRRMYDFIERLVNVALPRVRDFQGISVKGMDGRGNYSLGLKEVTIFPELSQENINKTHGLQINVATSARNNVEAYALLKALGFPFRDQVKNS